MKRMIFALAALLVLSADLSALGSGTTLVCTDAVMTPVNKPNYVNSWVVSGWYFHSGGAAIVRQRVEVDGVPYVTDETSFGWYMVPRPDVRDAYAPYGIVAPMVTGAFVSMGPWESVPYGTHTAQICVQDAEHGTLWTCSSPVSFTKK